MSQYTRRVPVPSLPVTPVISKSAFGLFNTLRTPPVAAPSSLPASSLSREDNAIPEELMREVRMLRSAGFGAVPDPQKTKWGWGLRMQGLILPGGSRTDALVLLPVSYPLASPIGFYLRKGANVGGLDTSHLYQRSYHGAPDLGAEGWQWFCGVAEGWIPGRHDLIGFISAMFAMLSERSA